MSVFSRSVRRVAAAGSVLALALTVAPPVLPSAQAAPVADSAAAYAACGRVFPDPHAFWPSPANSPGRSPWAKGNVSCPAVDFLGFQETLSGLDFLASDAMFPDFVEVFDLSDPDGPYAGLLDFAAGEGLSAGLATTGINRQKHPMVLVRVTDEEDTTIPIEDREHFIYTLSIHGIERAGIEGGIRAIEDLATWGSCEKHGDADSPANCAQEDAGPDNPHPILETIPDDSVTAGEALRKTAVYFILSNPDGWVRGDKQQGGFFFQRYNGNGMDMNRDWATIGHTYRPFTPMSEPENRTTAKVLKGIKDKWTGGIDLHGQLIDRAFSFTLIGGAERPYDKDRRVIQFVKGAYEDAETRLAWNPLIKGNDEPESCVPLGTSGTVNDPSSGCDPSNRIYGVQWGTIWDTIEYTVSGALGDWIDSPLGLSADGIDNEMSLSHLGNCGVGTCYLTEFEQLHVDGNKSLIYGMMHYSLLPEDTTFDYAGKAAYIHNPRKISDPGVGLGVGAAGADKGLPTQDDIAFGLSTHDGSKTTLEFEVEGIDDGVFNGGMSGVVTFSNLQGISGNALTTVAIDKLVDADDEQPPNPAGGDEGWEEQNTYFNQSFLYQQAGMRVDVNVPSPGTYRLRFEGGSPALVDATVEFTADTAWEDPGQLAFEATNMEFFTMLEEFVPNADSLTKITAEDVLSGAVDLASFDTVIAADDAFLPGYRDANDDDGRIQDDPVGNAFLDLYPDDNVDSMVGKWRGADADAMAAKVLAFAEGGGNVVLTDDSIRALAWMGLIDRDDIDEEAVYAGHVQFTTDATGGSDETYGDPLGANIDQPGAAEGVRHRHQTVEPIPLGYAIEDKGGSDNETLPEWGVSQAAWESAGGRTVGTLQSGKVVVGELPVGDGVVRIAGSLLPFPTDLYDHPFGVADYALTYTGYELLRNLVDHQNPNGVVAPPPPAAPAPSPLPVTGGGLALVGIALLAGRERLRRGFHAIAAANRAALPRHA